MITWQLFINTMQFMNVSSLTSCFSLFLHDVLVWICRLLCLIFCIYCCYVESGCQSFDIAGLFILLTVYLLVTIYTMCLLFFLEPGGQSFGCPENAGAAGTAYDRTLKSLRVSNDNFTTHTETPLLDFPTTTLWSNVFVENNAKALVPLLWTRVQVV